MGCRYYPDAEEEGVKYLLVVIKMSLNLRKRGAASRNPSQISDAMRQAMERQGTPPNPSSTGAKSVKYVELYGSLASIAAGLTSKIIEYTVPDGHCAEMYAFGVMPDWNVGAGASRLLDTTIATNDKDMGLKFLSNHAGMNSLPYGDRLSKQPMRLLDYPMRPGNLTPKFNEGVKLQIKATSGAVSVADIVRARARILLYEPSDVAKYYGTGISTFATLPGGVDQSMPKRLFADYARLSVATLGNGQWVDLYALSVKDYEEVALSHVGILPHANADELKIYDHRQKWEAPEYEPYYKITEGFNALPFGDDDDYQETAKLPSIIADHVFTNTDMKLQIKDAGAVIPQYGMAIQLFGTYKRVR